MTADLVKHRSMFAILPHQHFQQAVYFDLFIYLYKLFSVHFHTRMTQLLCSQSESISLLLQILLSEFVYNSITDFYFPKQAISDMKTYLLCKRQKGCFGGILTVLVV